VAIPLEETPKSDIKIVKFQVLALMIIKMLFSNMEVKINQSMDLDPEFN
jgi:hypothetical protein